MTATVHTVHTVHAIRWTDMEPPVQVAVILQCVQALKKEGNTRLDSADRLRRIFNLGNPRILMHDDGAIMRYNGIHPDDRSVMKLLFDQYL